MPTVNFMMSASFSFMCVQFGLANIIRVCMWLSSKLGAASSFAVLAPEKIWLPPRLPPAPVAQRSAAI